MHPNDAGRMANSVDLDQTALVLHCLPRPVCPNTYRNDPKFSDRYAWANSADPDQTVPGGAV